jgi:hypothetical protein
MDNIINKGIFTVNHLVNLTTDLMTLNDVAEYVGSHDIVATIRARWQHAASGPRLLDWELAELYFNGVLLTEETLPSDFPMQAIINACTISSRIRKFLEATGPGEQS